MPFKKESFLNNIDIKIKFLSHREHDLSPLKDENFVRSQKLYIYIYIYIYTLFILSFKYHVFNASGWSVMTELCSMC